jgi:hypothetical protein
VFGYRSHEILPVQFNISRVPLDTLIGTANIVSFAYIIHVNEKHLRANPWRTSHTWYHILMGWTISYAFTRGLPVVARKESD